MSSEAERADVRQLDRSPGAAVRPGRRRKARFEIRAIWSARPVVVVISPDGSVVMHEKGRRFYYVAHLSALLYQAARQLADESVEHRHARRLKP
jgi:hypothetical protein